VSDSGSGVKGVTVNGNPALITNGGFTIAVTLTDGLNEITTIATDKADNKSSADVRTITLDRTAPGLTITLPADNSITNKTFTEISGSVDDTNATVTTAINKGLAANVALSEKNFSVTRNLTPGLNTIVITAKDLAGNSASAKRTVTSDTSAPSLAITVPAQDISTTQGSVTISGSVTDTDTSVTIGVSVDDQTFSPKVAADGSFSQDITIVTDKSYTVIVTATDLADNKTSVSRNIIKTTLYPSGDINADGLVDIADALKVLRIAVGLDTATADNYTKADVAPLKAGKPALDGVIDIADVVVIMQKVVGSRSW
jgi:hypothetical protein